MNEVTAIVKLLGGTSSTSAKQAILKKYENTPGLKPILKFIYNPYCKTGISSAKLNKGLQLIAGRKLVPITYAEAIDYFTAHNTGSDADVTVAAMFVRYTWDTYGADAGRLAAAIVTQNLKVGVTATSLNTAYSADFIPKTGCMLGTLFENVGSAKVQWPCVVTEKLDGVRRILIKEKGTCRCYSRSGHEDIGLVEVIEEAKYLPDNFVYDGELLAKGAFKDSIAQRQATNSLANLKGIKTGLIFNVFDMVPVEDFYAGIYDEAAWKRKVRLGATFGDESIQLLDDDWARRICAFKSEHDFKHIASVPILGLVENLSQVEPIVETIWRRGGEGVMLNTYTSPYEIKRSKNLLKIKHTEEFVLPVVDILEGTGKYEDSMGSIVVKYKESFVGVGSGFTDDQRNYIWNNKNKFIGRKAEIESFGESTNAQGLVSLNCPIFLRFAGDEHE